MTEQITRRAIFFVGGYDPKSPQAFFTRMDKELARFEKLWGAKAQRADAGGEAETGRAVITNEIDGKAVETEFNFFVLDSLVLADFARPLPVRLAKYLAAFADFVVTGTAFRIFAKAWRFGLYFLFPFLMICAFAALGWIVAKLTQQWLGWMSIILGLVVFALAQWKLGERWPVNHLMDLWSFSRNFIRGNRADADALMDRFADCAIERVKSGKFDEVILIGHSTGGLLILDIAGRCLERDLNFTGYAPHVSVLTLGSTALKAGLHPAAKQFRSKVKTLADDGRLHWVEIQCLTDVINFYKTNPAAEMHMAVRDDFTLVRRMRVKDMLEAETYKRIKKSFFRVHYQYIFGNTKPYWFDFFQVCCGPIPLLERAEEMIVGSGTAKDNATI
ncbi:MULTISPECIES: lipase [Mesorhizobium]|uniref:Lipase n=1 Tax=Mesorhizobium denitrificans TaxID=2294114 RepID=A0A371XII8_9HYPH|nr:MULTISPECIES: lipase [Mesorhizobium]RFC69048.1 lipase [Mesorhizobium denitrificans]